MRLHAIARATIGRPDHYAIVAAGNRGHMRSWRFDDPTGQQTDMRIGLSQRKVSQEWDYERGASTMRYYPALRCAAPAPKWYDQQSNTLYNSQSGIGEWQVHTGSTTASGWTTVFSDAWQEWIPAGYPRVKWLWWYDGRGAKLVNGAQTTYAGRVTQREVDVPRVLEDDPCFLWQIRRAIPHPSYLASHYTYAQIALICTHPIGEYMVWVLTVPGFAASNGYREVYLSFGEGEITDGEPPSSDVTARFQVPLPEADGFGVIHDRILWETIDGHIHLSVNGNEPYVYFIPQHQRPYLMDQREELDGTLYDMPTVLRSLARVQFFGQPAMFNLSRIDFPGTGLPAQVDLNTNYALHPDVFACATEDKTGRCTAWTPVGTTATCVGMSESADTDGSNLYRPRVQCSSDQAYRRAAVYVGTIDWEPTLSAGTSDTYTTDTDEYLYECHGTVNEDWRYSNAVLNLEVPSASAQALVEKWKGNNYVQVVCGWKTDGADDTATHFTGYLTEKATVLPTDRPERVQIELPCQDAFWRLEKKYWHDLANFEGQDANEVYARVLHQCGFPDAYISVSAAVLADPENYTVRRARIGADPRFDFQEDTSVIEGLNTIMSSLGLAWGVNQSGIFFLRPPSVYTAGTSTVAWTLDEDTLDEAEYLFSLRESIQYDELADGRPFRNYVLVRVNRGGEEQVCEVWDFAADGYSSKSHHDSTDPNFIGDDWWHVMVGESEQSAYDLANRILRDRMGREGVVGRARSISFHANHKVSTMPGEYIWCAVSGLPAEASAVYQITRKDWNCTSDGVYSAQFTARYIEPIS